VLLLAAFSSWAQGISYSPYSVYGIGVLKERTSAYNRALSETGIGISDPSNLNTLNPASYAAINNGTQITELGFFFERSQLANRDLEARSSGGSLTSLSLWFRFSKRWAGTVGLSPFSTIKYDITGRDTNVDGDETSIRYQGNGGLTQLYFGNGFQLSKNLTVGFNASYIFGSITKEETILSGQASGLGVENKTRLTRPTIDVGVQYSLFFAKNRTVTFGATAANRVRLNTSRSARVYEVNGDDSLYVEQIPTDDFVLPANIGVGVSLNTPRHMVAADLKFKNWSDGRLGSDVTLRDTYRTSVGYEYKGNPNASSYWGFVALRSSFYVQNNYMVFYNNPFNQWGFSLGAGLPVAGNRGMLSVSYNYNRDGTLENRLIEQRAQVFVIDIVFRDLWGIKRRFD
jgi:hypothetical protein